MDGPLVQFEQILKRASEKKASDIHLKNGLPPIIRVNGGLFYLSDEAGEIIPRLSHFQLTQICQQLMNERQKIKYEGGEEVDLAHEILGLGRFRINICQQRSFPRLSCRLIPEQIRTLSELGIPLVVEDLVFAERGLVLIGGATGSGKSTTLAAMIDHIAKNTSSHIITLEDPIEYIFKDRKSIITQREVGIDTKNFPQALKYALRQDPDVIFVGESRDPATAEDAFQAALTGHLVLTTFHAGNTAEAITRLLEMQIEPYLIRSGLRTVICQRLLRKICANCRDLVDHTGAILSQSAESERTSDKFVSSPAHRIACAICGSTGYHGRLVLAEMLNPNSPKVAKAILNKLDAPEVARLAIASGMQTMEQRAATAVANGETTYEEVLRVLGSNAQASGVA